MRLDVTPLADVARRSGTVRRAARRLSPEFRDTQAVRKWIARRHLSGDGVEIGALHLPLPVPRNARVRLMYAVPDKRHTFDAARPVTPLDHFVRDHAEGPDRSRAEHYREWAELVKRVPADQVESEAARFEAASVSIHFHVWTPSAFAEFVVGARRAAGLELELEALHSVQREFVVVLRRP